MIIAIDGHSACGKSTLAKDIANSLHFTYIDSGAMYRAATLYLLENQFDMKQSADIENAISKIEIEFTNADLPKVLLNQIDVTDKIRNPEISNAVSEVATNSFIRKKMVKLQQKFSENKSVVMDGRDIGSVVFPHAEVKIFLTADFEVRAIRRHHELQSLGIKISLDEIRSNLKKRDYIDSTRKDSPLIQCPDAYIIDNSHLTRKEQLYLALKYICRINPALVVHYPEMD